MSRTAKKTSTTKRLADEEELISQMMFREYREENAKDMEREARGNW
jgi:hypothetical protein